MVASLSNVATEISTQLGCKNTNYNHSEVPLMSIQITVIKKQIKTNVDEEKLELSCTAGRNVKWCSHCGKEFGS